jgi:nucleoid DNA-binding protein
MSTSLEEAIAAFVRDKLRKKEAAELPGIGTFSVIHEPAADTADAKGKRGRKPPKDTIHFVPEASA